MYARCVQAFAASEPGDLGLAEGEFVTVLDAAEDGWWKGRTDDGRKGLFPGNHVEVIESIATVGGGPPAALRFIYDGADYHESARLHGLATAYEGLFRLVPDKKVKGRPAWRHTTRPDKWIAFTGSGWMAQLESALGTARGVLLLKDTSCETPDQSRRSWHVSPGWKEEPGLRVLAMSEDAATTWELESNPWGEGAAANDAMDAMSALLAQDPNVRVARDRNAPLAERLAAMDLLQAQAAAGALHHAQPNLEGAPRQPKLTGTRDGGARPPALQSKGGGGGAPRMVPMAGGMLYVGDVGASGKPHGGGQLLLKDGSVHVGLFQEGAAHGDGIYYDRKGSVHSGAWVTNHRVGGFEVLDPAGGMWTDAYDQFGARKSRKKAREATGLPADFCRHCGVKFHAEHQYACRRHTGQFDGLRWSCCDAGTVEDPGCQIYDAHEA